MKKNLLITSLFIFSTVYSFAQYTQIGNKLVGTGAVGEAFQGYSVCISGDGKTALVGAWQDDANTGAVWVYTHNGSNFVQLGNKLVGAGATLNTYYGVSISLSADGKRAVVGASGYNYRPGAVWVYSFDGNSFIQVGNVLTGTGIVGTGTQGSSVSISADGNTIVAGGTGDNSDVGAAWVYTFNGSNYVQVGNKLVGVDVNGTAARGASVSLSGDAKTIVVGGYNDNGGVGAIWIYTFNGSNYIQFGSKLVGNGIVETFSGQGCSVSCSLDGKTVLVGGYADNLFTGAAWIFTFNGTNFVQFGTKLVGTGAIGAAYQGYSVSLSADGKTAVLGGVYNNSLLGAAWIFTFNGSAYIQAGNKLVGSGSVGTIVGQGFSIDVSADGNFFIMGAPGDNSNIGAAWIFSNTLAENNTGTGTNTSTTGNNTGTGTNTSTTGNNTNTGSNTSTPGMNTTSPGTTNLLSTQTSESFTFEVFPNPTSGTFEIKSSVISTNGTNFEVAVYNSIGQHISTLTQGVFTLPKGIYYLRYGTIGKKLLVE